MNRILPLLSLPLLSLAAVFAANTPEHIGNDLKLFKDSSCTSLKPDVKDTSAFQSDAMKELAAKILAGHYKPDYLYAEYRALPSPREESLLIPPFFISTSIPPIPSHTGYGQRHGAPRLNVFPI